MDVAILDSGLVMPVGLCAEAACAAIRSKLTNPSPSGFIDSTGEPIMAHQVALERPWRGLPKLARMAAMAIGEALSDVPVSEWGSIPLLLCVAETDRPGRLDGLDDRLFHEIEALLGVRFPAESGVLAHGRIGVALALAQAQRLLENAQVSRVVIAACDSLVEWATLLHYEHSDRLLTAENSDGFMPGEGAGALLMGRPAEGRPALRCTGVGLSDELAVIGSERAFRADGLSASIMAARASAHWQMSEVDFRITDLAGEHYYFKEAALALSRTLRNRRTEMDIWHPAESTGESGAAAGLCAFVVADDACRKGYARGRRILVHLGTDAGARAAVTLEFGAH